MRAVLLNDGGFIGLEFVDFPVVVDCAKVEGCDNLISVFGGDIIDVDGKGHWELEDITFTAVNWDKWDASDDTVEAIIITESAHVREERK